MDKKSIKRISSIDAVRGLVVVIMALDHCRELLHITSVTDDPTNLATTTPWLFMTRWVTHLCAPTFVFLSGTSAYLLMKKREDLPATRNFLLVRGIFLVVLEITFVNFGIWFDLQFRTLMLQVIFAIGASFICLAFLIWVPSRILLVAGLLILIGHNALDGLNLGNSIPAAIVRYLLYPTFSAGPYLTFLEPYPILPWLGIMLFGFGFGEVYRMDEKKRKQLLWFSAAACLLCFVLLRWNNSYGDAAPWMPRSNQLFSFLSFIKVTKYPPSLLYVSITLGIMFLFLQLTENSKWLYDIWIVYGRVPLFFYLVHWYVIHLSLLVLLFLKGYGWDVMSFASFGFGRPAGGQGGITLPWVYLYWVSLLVFMYFLCQWFARIKARNHHVKWLAYF